MSRLNQSVIARVAIPIALLLLFIALGLGVRFALRALYAPPEQEARKELPLEVDVQRVRPETAPVSIVGYGETRARDTVVISPKVAGEVVEIHPQLEVGAVVAKGALLLRIDPTDYQAQRAQAAAQVEQMRNRIARLKKQYAIDQSRIDTLERTRDIAREEFERDRILYEEKDVGTESLVNLSEINFNQAQDAYTQLSQAVELYPISIQEAESGLDAALVALEMAETSLARTEIHAPFDGRIKMVQAELGQIVAPGNPVLALADDSLLEISVPLDSRDARRWLQFENEAKSKDLSWFGEPTPVRCSITWTEGPGGHKWEGVLDRVERFDQMTRTVSVAVRVTAAEALSNPGLPLVEGMFCEVAIPGKEMEEVFRLPRSAVSFEGDVYVAEPHEGAYRLAVRRVEVVRTEGDFAYVGAGLKPDDLVITTRLVNPLRNSLLEVASIADAPLIDGEPSLPDTAP